eukprot:CAMPEP_0182874098 /NCGR_PEP_ID=MMETSP0034_2-20130328/12730_1 /TAXON_ID=156128 /ORGANISM="Nephroselmis pyriformis, Strain CCMP717" /LENGTH=262 /DNA_ID=CAMNT_0025006793 /DNA_START=151 /DNA_END=936 /DNA_ORIENTATION=-
MFKKVFKRGDKKGTTATGFDFEFRVHRLQPWPAPVANAKPKALSVAWQRGSKRSGALQPVYPEPSRARSLNVSYNIEQSFVLPATLYKEGAGKEGPGGTFRKKCAVISVLEVQPGQKPKATAALGRVVVDLAEYASYEGSEERQLPVACSKAITGAVGNPVLFVTVSCRWRKSGRGARGAPGSDASTDTTASTFSRMGGPPLANFRFNPFAARGGPANDDSFEQDLDNISTLSSEPEDPDADVAGGSGGANDNGAGGVGSDG